MEIGNRNIFWEALIVAILLFASGIFLGYLLELNRVDKIITLYQDSELNLLDIRVQSDMLSFDNLDCDSAVRQLILFADKIYEDARTLERYEGSSELSKGIIFQHKRYDLLRTILWVNSIQLKERCGKKFNTIVYFYEYQSEDVDIKNLQSVFANKLGEVKRELGDKVILIPIAGNLEISSINYLKKLYNISLMPAILIDESIKIDTNEGLKNINSNLK